MSVTRSSVKHKPGKRVKVKKRFYEELLQSVEDLKTQVKEAEQKQTRYGNLLEETVKRVNGTIDLTHITEQVPELFE